VRSIVYTKDVKHPRIVIELACDIDLLVACVKEGEVDPAQVASQLAKGVSTIVAAMHKGVAKAKAEADEQ
jgi:hypothetical protein